jgi:hypothetical protein
MSPIESFWQFVAWLGLAPWVFKAGCALVALIYVYRHRRHWEHLPLMVGFGCIVTSPWFTPAGPIGDWLVYPSITIVLARGFYEHKPMIDARMRAEGPPPEKVILDTLRGRPPTRT